MDKEKITSEMLYRTLSLGGDAIQSDDTIEVSFSSETPHLRSHFPEFGSFGYEILDHSAVDLSFANDGAPFLIDHKRTDYANHVGVVKKAWVEGDKARAKIIFSDRPEAKALLDDIKKGIRTKISVGYVITDIKQEMSLDGKKPVTKDGHNVYRVPFKVLEISSVAVPADETVGTNRAGEGNNTKQQEEKKMTENKVEEKIVALAPAVDERALRADIQKEERARVSEIHALGQSAGLAEVAQQYIRDGKTVIEFKDVVLADYAKRNFKVVTASSADIGLSEREAHQFSFVRAINALANGSWKGAEFELETSQAVTQQMARLTGVSKDPRGFYVPNDVLRRDLNVTTATAGGHTVATDLLVSSFIELLRNAMVTRAMGTVILSGLVGNVAIPRHTAASSAFWVSESGAPTESQQAFDQVALTPKTLGAFTDLSRKLILQSSLDIESWVRSELATTLAIELDRVVLHGSGSAPEPRGVFNVSGIGDVAGGTNGLAPTWAHIVELETDVSVANAAIGNLGYITNAKVRGKLKTTEKASSTAQFVWGDGANPLNGYAVGVSNQVRSDLTKGSGTDLSAIFFGNWAEVVVGQWGVLDVMIDPYAGATSGTVRVIALQDVDVAVRHAASFSVMKDAITV